jgi:hypothetical protein
MSYPKIQFKLDPRQDYQNYLRFQRFAEPRFVRMFLPEEIRHEIRSCGTKRAADDVVRKFVLETHRNNSAAIVKNVARTERAWNALSRRYYRLVDQVFKGHPWPKGRYVGYASVFCMYPRYIDDRLFYFPALESKPPLGTVSHEMLHFMFFSYLKRHYNLTQESVVPGRGSNYVWNVSEVFNLTMESWKPYRSLLKTSGKPYDGMHARMLPRMKRLWRESEDIEVLLRQYFGRPKVRWVCLSTIQH